MISGAHHHPSIPHRLIDIEVIFHRCLDLIQHCIGRNEWDPDGTASLDRDTFAHGTMWVGEELWRA